MYFVTLTLTLTPTQGGLMVPADMVTAAAFKARGAVFAEVPLTPFNIHALFLQVRALCVSKSLGTSLSMQMFCRVVYYLWV